jgi:hypothetical protein
MAFLLRFLRFYLAGGNFVKKADFLKYAGQKPTQTPQQPHILVVQGSRPISGYLTEVPASQVPTGDIQPDLGARPGAVPRIVWSFPE